MVRDAMIPPDDSTAPSKVLPTVLFSAEQIQERTRALGQQIHAAMAPGPLTIVSVLRGAFMFTADLVRHIPRDLQVEFLGVRSYGDETESSGVVEITHDLLLPIKSRQVLLVEDIVDTGLTLRYLLDSFAARGPMEVRVCALLSKPARRRVDVPVDFVGFEVPDRFVVGYGMDAGQRFRTLPYIGVLDDENAGAGKT